MWRLQGIVTWTALLAVAYGVSCAQPAEGQSAYDRMDSDKLANKLVSMKMSPLLEALVAKSKKGIKGKALLARSKIGQALRATDQQQRDRLLTEATDLQTQLIQATADAKDDQGTLLHFRYRLDRIIVEGITKVEPYSQRVMYFLGTAEDRSVIDKHTAKALQWLRAFQTDLELKRDEWGRSEERMVTGVLWRLEALMEEGRYRGGWIRFSRAAVLPKTSPQRDTLLQQAIADVKGFAEAEDNSSGVKFASLLLSGMAARELGLWNQAMSYLKRADTEQSGAGERLKAKFETVRVHIDQQQFAQAETQMKVFKTEGLKLPGIGPVAVDMQSALLKYKLLADRADLVKSTNPGQYDRLRNQAGQTLLDFIQVHPQYRQAFWDIISALFEGVAADKRDPMMNASLAVREFSKQTPEGLAKAEELFQAVLKAPRSTDKLKGSALWHLGLIQNLRKKNFEAARLFRQLAAKYPADPNAMQSALNAVKSFQGILKERGVEPAKLGNEFVREYSLALKVLVDGWGAKDPKVRTYNYELGLMYKILGKQKEAIDAFAGIPQDSDLYMPSRFMILESRVNSLLDATNMARSVREQLGRSLVGDLTSYMGRARGFYRSDADEERKMHVLGWGAECGVLIAKLYKDVLNNPSLAMQRATELTKDAEWKKVPGIERRAQECIIEMLLEAGQAEKVIPMLTALVKGDDSRGAEILLARAVSQIGDRIERLTHATDPDSQGKLQSLRKAYRLFAEQLYKFVDQSDLTEEQKMPFKQALAHAYEFGANQEALQSLRLYEELAKKKPNDGNIVRGICRAHRVLGNKKKAMDHYDELINGLPEKSAAWWRGQLERLQYGLEIYTDSQQGLKSVMLQIRILRYKDSELGGYWRQFADVEARTKKLLGSEDQAGGTTQPGQL